MSTFNMLQTYEYFLTLISYKILTVTKRQTIDEEILSIHRFFKTKSKYDDSLFVVEQQIKTRCLELR